MPTVEKVYVVEADESANALIARLPVAADGEAHPNKVLRSNDTRLENLGMPSGQVPVGGDLAGEYPSPNLIPVPGLAPGTYTFSEVTVDQKGRVTAISSGSPTGVPHAEDDVEGRVFLSVVADDVTIPIAVGTNDPRVPTQNENNALVGTSGSPSTANPYVTEEDSRLDDARAPAGAVGNGGDLAGSYPAPVLATIPGLAPGTYSNTNVTVDAKGRVVEISDGVAGSVWTLSILDEGSTLPQRDVVDIVGAGVTVTDNNPDEKTVITIPGPLQSSSLQGFHSGYNLSVATIASGLATHIEIGSGAIYIPALGNVLEHPAPTTLALDLPASTQGFFYVYVYDGGGGVPAFEVSSVVPVTYRGLAKHKTGDNTRRFIGSVFGFGSVSNGAVPFIRRGMRVFWNTNINRAPFIVLADGRGTTSTTVSAATMVPPGHRMMITSISNSTAQNSYIGNPEATPTVSSTTYLMRGSTYSGVYEVDLLLDSSRQFNYIWSSAPSIGAGLEVVSRGYIEELY